MMARLSAASRLSSAIRMRLREQGAGHFATVTLGQLGNAHVTGYRETDDELAAFAETLAADFDVAAVQLKQSLDERQADAQPALRPFQGRLHLRKHLKQSGQMLGSDPNAGVLDQDHNFASPFFSAVSQM